MNKLRVSCESARKADELATIDCTHLWKLVLLMERLNILTDKQLLNSIQLYSINFYREIVHLKDIYPDLENELDEILLHIKETAV